MKSTGPFLRLLLFALLWTVDCGLSTAAHEQPSDFRLTDVYGKVVRDVIALM